jgi:hypothetical protein
VFHLRHITTGSQVHATDRAMHPPRIGAPDRQGIPDRVLKERPAMGTRREPKNANFPAASSASALKTASCCFAGEKELATHATYQMFTEMASVLHKETVEFLGGAVAVGWASPTIWLPTA